MNSDILLSILLTIQDDLYVNRKPNNIIISSINEYIAWLETGEERFAKDYVAEKLVLESIRYNIVRNEMSEAKENLKSYIKSLM